MSGWPRIATAKRRAAPKAAARPAAPSEDTIQAQVITWANKQLKVYPELARLFHVPNGGQRHVLVAVNLKRQGVKAGVPDLCLPVPRFGCHGLWIEMKTKDGSISATQKDWIGYLQGAGYRVEVCRSFDEARGVLTNYLNPKSTYSPGII